MLVPHKLPTVNMHTTIKTEKNRGLKNYVCGLVAGPRWFRLCWTIFALVLLTLK